MVTVKRPERIFSFSDHQRQQPNQPPPGDRLDAQFMQLAEAIRTTQDALAQIRRDDGLIKAPTKLEPHLTQELINNFTAAITPTAMQVAGTAQAAQLAERQAQLYAADAEAAVASSDLAGQRHGGAARADHHKVGCQRCRLAGGRHVCRPRRRIGPIMPTPRLTMPSRPRTRRCSGRSIWQDQWSMRRRLRPTLR